MHKTNFLDKKAQVPNFLLSLNTKTQDTSKSLPKSASPLVPMCHQHLCKGRHMTGLAESSSCLDSHKYEQSVRGLNGNSEGEEGGELKETVIQSVPSHPTGLSVSNRNHPSLSRCLVARYPPSHKANNKVIMFFLTHS